MKKTKRRCPVARLTKRDLQRVIRTAPDFPYTIYMQDTEDSEPCIHSVIQTPSDERMFLDFASRAKVRYFTDEEETRG